MCDTFTNIFRIIPQSNLILTYVVIHYKCINYSFFRLLFFSMKNPTGIYKASLDGTKVIPVVSGLGKSMGLDIDCTGRVCWADYSKYHAIASIKPSTCRRCLGATRELHKLLPHAGLDRSVCPSVNHHYHM